MRPGLSNRAVDLVRPGNEDAAKHAELMAGISPLVDPKALRRAVAEGFLEPLHVTVDGVPHYCVWVSVALDGGLHINAAVQLVPKPAGMEYLLEAMQRLAFTRGLSWVRLNTARDGGMKKLRELGWEPVAVCFVKHIGNPS